jgi:hypothetical protein
MGVGVPLIDSDGDGVDDNFKFELGAFALDFDPNESNVGEWLTHWRVFDSLIFDSVFGFSTSSTTILNNVTSESQFASDPTFSFSKLEAYIWVRGHDDPEGNRDIPAEGSQWLLVRAGSWTFPEFGGDCCATEFIKWSTIDLTPASDQIPGDVPKWGLQNNVSGGEGVFNFTVDPEFDGLQTHTFIPEPSSALLTLLAGFGLLLRRRRNA